MCVAHVEGARARARDDPVRADRRAVPGEPRQVVAAVVHRVVGDVHDVVAQRGAGGEGGARRRARVRTRGRRRHRDRQGAARDDATVCACPRPRAPPPSTAPSGSSSTARTCSTASARARAGRRRASAIVGRIRGAVPDRDRASTSCSTVGHGVYGRLAQKMAVRYSGRRPADDVILDLTSESAMQHGGPAAADRVLVDHQRPRPARPARGEGRPHRAPPVAHRQAGRPGAHRQAPANARRPSIGAGRPPAGSRGGVRRRPADRAPRDDDEDRSRWKPGRGATAKTGTPNKVARHKRHPRPAPERARPGRGPARAVPAAPPLTRPVDSPPPSCW